MNSLIKQPLAHVLALFVLLAGCGPSLVIQQVNYSQPVESVLTPDSEGNIHDQRFAVQFSVNQLLEAEGIAGINEIRLIRNNAGYYFVTANGFSNVYVFEPGEAELSLAEQIEFPEALQQPAFNQRGSYIELVTQNLGQTYNLDQNGVQE